MTEPSVHGDRTSAHAPFLDLILRQPEADAPRLVYADWLDERNDPRGEYIRVQIALTRLPSDSPQRAELKRRIAHMEAHPNEGISFEEFYERTLKKYEL